VTRFRRNPSRSASRTNPVARDFRLETIGSAYRHSALQANGDGKYVAKVPEPAHGWTAYFVELTFASGKQLPFKFTTGVRVIPDLVPFGPPPELAAGEREQPRGR